MLPASITMLNFGVTADAKAQRRTVSAVVTRDKKNILSAPVPRVDDSAGGGSDCFDFRASCEGDVYGLLVALLFD